MTIFIVGSVACALAPTLWALVAARALQGIGGGGILPIAQTIIADLVPPRERPRYQTQSAAMFMIASIVGPVLGGFFTDHLHWSLIFWINVPMGALALVMTQPGAARAAAQRAPAPARLGRRRPDGGGRVRADAGHGLGRRALPLGVVADPRRCWPPRRRCGGCSRGASRPRAEPFIPLAVLREPVVAGNVVAAGFFSIGAIIGLSIYLPLYLELVLGASRLDVGPRADRLHGRHRGRGLRGRPRPRPPSALHAHSAGGPAARDRGPRRDGGRARDSSRSAASPCCCSCAAAGSAPCFR